jgi:hypothetical protein
MELGDLSETGRWPPQVRTVVDLAISEARTLNHHWLGQDHLLLALRPDCPGAAPAVLRSLGATVALRAVLTASMGEPFEPGGAGITLTPATRLLLERASLEASGLAAAEVSSEHVLLALTRRWGRGRALRQYFVDRDGNPVLTVDGRPVGLLVDQHGDFTRDAQGRPIGPAEIPPGCEVRRASS